MTELIAFSGTMILVFSRAIQQQNVIGGHYLAAALTPVLIAAGEIAIVGAIVIDGWYAWPWISAGGGIGAVSAMWVHRLFFASRSPAHHRSRP